MRRCVGHRILVGSVGVGVSQKYDEKGEGKLTMERDGGKGEKKVSRGQRRPKLS